MKKINFIASAIAALVVASGVNVSANDEPDYLRSSLYTILIKSDAQAKRLEEENAKEGNNMIMSAAKSLAKTDEKKAANDTLGIPMSQVPAYLFTTIAIPPQFNDHNLAALRFIDFDAIRAGLSEEDAAKATESLGMKGKSKGAKLMKGLGSSALGAATGQQNSSLINTDEVDEYAPAVILNFFNSNNIPAQVTAEWFDYGKDPQNLWGDATLNERALQSLNVAEQNDDNANKMMAASKKAINLIPNTFVLITNLRFRSNQAIVAEAQAIADAAGSQFGAYGQLASQVAGAAASAAAGDGFAVQAVTYLFRLVWDESVEAEIGKLMASNGSIDDLIASGVCRLEFVGKEKQKANVRQSLFSDKPISDLIGRATTRAIDKSIAKLQEKNEVFRSVFPISSFDKDGKIQVKIGAREGVSKGDVYSVLEKREDAKTGEITYKEIGTVKPDEKLIWNNLAGAEEEAAENKAHQDAKASEEGVSDDAVSLGATTFVGKKGKDYSGCYIQLKKKK